MANKYDLKTWQKVALVDTQATAATVGTNATNIGGAGAVPAGKTRFLTFIRVTRHLAPIIAASRTILRIGDLATSKPTGASMTAGLKVPITVGGIKYSSITDGMVVQELNGSIEHPILAVAGGKCMGVAIATGATANVFAQYFDE